MPDGTLPVESERETGAVPCKCNGYCDSVEPTWEEEKKYGCGITRCCARAFVCRLCGARYAGSAPSPEME